MRLLLAMALVGCAPRPQAVEPPAVATPWCFAVALAWDGRTEAGEACGSTWDVCESVRRRASRFGGMVGIKEVGTCQRR